MRLDSGLKAAHRPPCARLLAGALALTIGAGLAVCRVAPGAAATATVTVSATVTGRTPAVLGYNTAHAMSGSNVDDWWRYSGVRAARVFVSASDIEPGDDIPGTGDGVTSRVGFDARRAAVRANAADSGSPLDPTLVDWADFQQAYAEVATGNNRFTVASWFPRLRTLGNDILVNITASPSRFPLADTGDEANAWELWQHYYAQAFILSRDYAVTRYSMFNEPNGWTPAISVANWARRLRIASDAIQAAVTDMSARYGRSLVATVLAPNTANGTTKYADVATGDTWGRTAVTTRSLDRWGDPAAPGWSNFHVYNYQKYTTSPTDYTTDYDALRSAVAADTGGNPPPFALTEFNVRTGSNYDARTETADSPSDYSALGAVGVALAGRDIEQLYLFKFGMTERTGGTYPVAKNGTHYVDNETSAGALNEYGGAAGTAEVYRLFVKAAGSGRDRLAVSSTLGSAVAVQATRDTSGNTYVFLANTGTATATVDVDLSALGIADGSLVTVEEVSTSTRGAVARSAAVTGGRIPAATMPAQSVWLVSTYPGRSAGAVITADADATLGDGSARTTPGGSVSPLVVRADGTVTGRRVSLVRFPVPTAANPGARILLSLTTSTTAGSTPTQAHVYGLETDSWSEAATSFSTLTTALDQNVGAGSLIANNVVRGQGTTTRILGQLVAVSTTATEKLIDVTDFVAAQTDGYASFLIAQDHRWNVRLPEKTAGDTQSAGLRIAARTTGTPPRLRIFPGGGPTTTTTTAAPTTTTTVAPTTTTTTTAPAARITAEFERLAVAATSGDSIGTKSDAGASGGKSILYRANAVGDYIVFRLDVPTAGRYAVELLAKMQSDRALVQLSVGRSATGPWTDVDTPKDEYRPSITFGSVGTFAQTADLSPAGAWYLRLRVTGRNPAGSGYNVSADRITLQS